MSDFRNTDSLTSLYSFEKIDKYVSNLYTCLTYYTCIIFSTTPRDCLRSTSPKWPILCRVKRKTLTESVHQLVYLFMFCLHFAYLYFVYIFSRSVAIWRYWHFTARFDGVHALGYNSAEREPIWMKSGALLAHCLGLALADLGRDLRSSESWRARLSFVFCQVSNPRFYRFPVGQISWNLNITRGSARQWNEFFQRLASSGRHNSAVITDRRKFIPK